ncbi:lipopolysaccharide 3-alpha-galactosyltransferase [Citrobacter koseri]|uniref:lipopolysaccharide 3-alpha-galactosyltransferase n=1 Tax=Citrobacter koseri TaxID=545 RepID=UPI001A1FB0D3|nr:lipopolysaccharide 3-alpha-galactosyltransferase [Citrobacter koseri]HDQ2586083.1 lipopolysaccharide 3-alpha-galactosyltransferase [Citrobacter koseri]
MSSQYFNPDEMIAKTTIFDERFVIPTALSLNVAYGIDKNFLFGCGVSITSVLLHNREVDFVFHVFIDDIPEDDISRLAQLAKTYKTCIQIHVINCEQLKTLPTTKNWSIAMYFRFVIGDYFIGQQDRILYLDADIICKGSLQPLTFMDLADNVAAVVTERDANWWALRANNLLCNELQKGYFNSGVLLININSWKMEHVSSKAMLMLSDKKITSRLIYMDQDILNLILVGKVKFIDVNYNTQFSLNYELKQTVISPVKDKTVLIHYVGPTKPWHLWACYPSAEPFVNAKEVSPWKNVPFMRANNANYARYCAKHKFKQNKPISGIVSYIYYFYLKIMMLF